MNTDHIKTGNFPIIRPLALHDLEVNLDVTVFGCRDMRRSFVDFAFESCQLYLRDSLFCVVTFLLTSDIDGFGLEAMAEDGLVQILVPWHDWLSMASMVPQWMYQRPFEVQCGTPKCAEALLVLDTDGGRLAVKYNSLARKDSIFCYFFFHGCHLS